MVSAGRLALESVCFAHMANLEIGYDGDDDDAGLIQTSGRPGFVAVAIGWPLATIAAPG